MQKFAFILYLKTCQSMSNKIETINPATGKVIATYDNISEEVSQKVKKAKGAFGKWGNWIFLNELPI